jgi:VanZ family protein
MDATGRYKKTLGLVCALVLCAISIAGLWPFHAPKNEVSWRNNGGLHFGKHGVVLTPDAFHPVGLSDGLSCTVEIWLQPDHTMTGGTIFAFYTPKTHTVAFSAYQSIDDLLLRRVTLDGQPHAATKLYLEHIFRKEKQLFVTITSSAQGTFVYVNGALARTSLQFGLTAKELIGQLVLGNSPLANDGWQGEVRGLAVYHREFNGAEVLQHYNTWATSQTEEIEKTSPVALYLFNEGKGDVIQDQINSETNLHIPKHYLVLQPQLLEMPWDEFQPTWSYWENVLINIGGFVPLGFFFCAFFASLQRFDRAALVTVVWGVMVSLTIEVLQAFLPTRDSGVTDILTNTLGTGIGAMLFSCEIARSLLATLGPKDWLGRFADAS